MVDSDSDQVDAEAAAAEMDTEEGANQEASEGLECIVAEIDGECSDSDSDDDEDGDGSDATDDMDEDIELEEEEEEEEDGDWESEDEDEGGGMFYVGQTAVADRALQHLPRVADISHEPLEADIAQEIRMRSDFEVGSGLVRTAFSDGSQKPIAHALKWRETGAAGSQGFSPSQKCSVTAGYLPTQPKQLIEEMDSRGYIGQFTKDGSLFVSAYQDNRICVFDTENNFKLRKNVTARNLRWTVTDTCMSPDQRLLIYASITSSVHVVNMGSRADGVYSIANITDIHEEMNLGGSEEGRFGIWSIKWSTDGRELIAGTTDSSLVIYDVGEEKAVAQVAGHVDDVNAISYLDESGNLIATGSDDQLCKVWDRRTLSASRPKPMGVLVGHNEGVTHIDPKGDGRHFISNSKDQTCKLWDIRKMYPGNEYRNLRFPSEIPRFRWDYRWMEYPGTGYVVKHPHDVSLRSFYGHGVLQTLIRCYFSPMHSTGQRFIYTGSREGAVYVYDIISGKQVAKLQGHSDVVRDCSWHPDLPMMVTVSWDGRIVRWGPGRDTTEEDERPGLGCPSGKRLRARRSNRARAS